MTTPAPQAYTWPDLLTTLLRREDLSTEQASWAMEQVMSGEASPVQLAGTAWELIGSGQLQEAIAVSARRAALGFLLGALIAFVLGGGGLLGAVEVGMLQALIEAGVRPDLVVDVHDGRLRIHGEDRAFHRADVLPGTEIRRQGDEMSHGNPPPTGGASGLP